MSGGQCQLVVFSVGPGFNCGLEVEGALEIPGSAGHGRASGNGDLLRRTVGSNCGWMDREAGCRVRSGGAVGGPKTDVGGSKTDRTACIMVVRREEDGTALSTVSGARGVGASYEAKRRPGQGDRAGGGFAAWCVCAWTQRGWVLLRGPRPWPRGRPARGSR